MRIRLFGRFWVAAILVLSSQAFAANTEELLRSDRRFGYSIGWNEKTEDHLKRIVQQMQNRVARVPEDNDQDYLMLGDTCHWIGHIYEEKQQLREARRWHEMSLEAYDKTTLRNSQRIGGGRLDCRTHAKLHLTVLDSGSSLTDLHDSAEHSQTQIGHLMARVLQQGIGRFGQDSSSPDFPIAMNCERIMETFQAMERAIHREFRP